MAVLTVSQVNMYIKSLLEEVPPIRNVYICGEISNFKHYYQSGHMYFTLKDDKSQLKCVMFSSDNYKLKFKPENGMNVICFGQIGVYERDGVYQLYARDMQVQGIGSLTVAYEQLKEKLEAAGLFAPEHKKPIPKYPQKIGVATSNMGAAVEDIKNVLGRRFPLCEVVIVPTVVQGDAAAPDIVQSIEMLDAMPDIDIIIVGRGGGSIEDLWAFNTELVAQAVYHCRTPIISAVGHETDFTICDFVADMRAPTPSAAAELAVPDAQNEMMHLQSIYGAMEAALTHRIAREETRISHLVNDSVLAGREVFLQRHQTAIDGFASQMKSAFERTVDTKNNTLAALASTLHALSPLAVLGRGYSITNKDGAVITSAASLKKGDSISVSLSDGAVNAVVEEVIPNE